MSVHLRNLQDTLCCQGNSLRQHGFARSFLDSFSTAPLIDNEVATNASLKMMEKGYRNFPLTAPLQHR
jgi:hypothetical protein